MIRNYRVCLADTDAFGIVHHARYFEMAERNHNEMLISLGVSVAELARREGHSAGIAALALHSVAAKFISPAFPSDLLTLETEIRKHGTARSRWHTAISRDGSPICDIDAEVVCINLRTGQPMRMPCTIDRALGRAAKEWIGVPAALAV